MNKSFHKQAKIKRKKLTEIHSEEFKFEEQSSCQEYKERASEKRKLRSESTVGWGEDGIGYDNRSGTSF